MKAQGFVLAAGHGSRLLPITQHLPKPLVPLGGLPLVGYALHLLRHAGIVDVCLNTHHLGSQLHEALGDGSAYGVQLTYSDEAELLGTGGALRRCRHHLQQTCVVLNSDTLVDVDLGALLRQHRARGALATMLLRRHPGTPEMSRIDLGADGRLQQILAAGPVKPGAQPCMFTGVQIVEPAFLDELPASGPSCVVRQGYLPAQRRGAPLFGALCDGFWADLGTPRRYLEVNDRLLGGELALPHVEPLGGLQPAAAAVTAAPPVWLAAGCQVAASARLGPAVLLAAGAQVAGEARLQHCVVLPGGCVATGESLAWTLVGQHGRATA